MSARKLTKSEKRFLKIRKQSGLDGFTARLPPEMRDGKSFVLKGANEKMYGVKISDALCAVCQPLLDNVKNDYAKEKKIFDLGVIAWNLAIIYNIGEDAFKEALESICDELIELDDMTKLFYNSAIALFVRRKLELFPGIDSMIVHYELVDEDGDMRLNVATIPCCDQKLEELKELIVEDTHKYIDAK